MPIKSLSDTLHDITLALPLSRLNDSDYHLEIYVRNLSSYYVLADRLKLLAEADPHIHVYDQSQFSVNYLGIAAMIRGLSAGFYILIALLCGIHVFYALSTNILLHSRDYGVLRSIGFTQKDLLKTAAVESLSCGLRALLIGIVFGLGLGIVSYGRRYPTFTLKGLKLPWGTFALGAGCILLLLLLGTLYGLFLLKKKTPIEAIREENI